MTVVEDSSTNLVNFTTSLPVTMKTKISGSPKGYGDIYHVVFTFFFSLSAVPFIYLLNTLFASIDDSVRGFGIMVLSFGTLSAIILVVYYGSRITDWMYLGMALFTWTAVIDSTISLEYLGITENFMSEYLKFGEPYLLSSWGSAICVFDGTGFYIMYLVLIYLFTNKKSWRSVGIYWAGAILNSMIVLITGVFTGKHSATFCTLLNIPYIVFPIFVLFRIFKTQNRSNWVTKTKIQEKFSIKVHDVFLILGFIGSIWIILAKFLVVLGSKVWVFKETVAPETALLLEDPARFYSIQVLLFFFYIIPAQIVSVYYLLQEEKPQYLWEMSAAMAGIMLQAQFSYILYSFDTQTPQPFRVDWTDINFWLPNVLLVIIPHLFIIRLYIHRVPDTKIAKKQ